MSVPGPDVLEKRFDVSFPEKEGFQRHYHVSSFTLPSLPVIADDDPGCIQLMKWGLVPFWVRDKAQAEEIRVRTMNARAESIYEKPAFRAAAEERHCLVLADGFFEWREVGGRNYPYYIFLKSREPFAFAGLWEVWVDRDSGDELRSFTVITTRANLLLEKIHNKKKRMPVILCLEDERRWIDGSVDKSVGVSFLEPYDDGDMEAYTISRLITAPDVDPDVPEVLEPFRYSELEDGCGQAKLFL